MGTALPSDDQPLKTYAQQRIELLRLGSSGPLGMHFVLAYDDADPAAVRLSDGFTDTACRNVEEIDTALQLWAGRRVSCILWHHSDCGTG